MAEAIPFIPGEPFQRFEVTLAGTPVIVEARYNSADEFFYLSFWESNETPILMGAKLVLGTRIGRQCVHPFFVGRALIAVDTAASKTENMRECRLDDIGSRVEVWYLDELDVEIAEGPNPYGRAKATVPL